MTQRGEAQLEKLRDEATCPSCEYSLRGLAGDVVTCPECGCMVEIVDLLAGRWKQPLRNAPYFNLLTIPVGWLLISSILFVFSMYRIEDAELVYSFWQIPLFVAPLRHGYRDHHTTSQQPRDRHQQ